MSFDNTYYTGTILPIIVFKWKDVNNALQFNTTTGQPDKTNTVKNDGSTLIGCYPNQKDQNNNNICPCYPKISDPDNSIFFCNELKEGCTNQDRDGQINYFKFLIKNGDYSLPIVEPNSNCSLGDSVSINTYYINVNVTNNCDAYGVEVLGKDIPDGDSIFNFGSCSLNIYSGVFDNDKSTTINGIPGKCIQNLNTNDLMYNFNKITFDNTYYGVQSNSWNVPIKGGWSISVDNDPNYSYGNFIGNEQTGSVQSRYYYTPLSNSSLDITSLINYIDGLPTSKVGNNQTTLLFSKAPCYPYFVKSTILYFFLSLFYSELYKTSTSSLHLFSNKDALSSSDRSKYLSQIQTLYESATGSLIVNSVSNTVVSSTVFTSFCMFPQVYFDTDSSVLIQVALPVSILMSTFTTDTVTTPTEFYKLTFSNQQKVLITIMRNFIQDNNGDYFTSYPDISNHHPLLPAEYELIQYDSTNPTAGYTDLLTCISALSNAGNTVQINLNQTAKPGTIYTNPSVYTKAYSICNDTSTVAPFCLYGLFNLKVKKWSVKLAAYCSQQFSNSTVPNSSSVLSVLPFLLLPNIYNKIAMDTSPTGDGLHGWILNDYYNYLTTNKAFDLYLGLLSNDCNSYFKSDGTPYYGISPYFLTPTGGIYNQSQLDCMCYHSLVAPKNVDSSGQKAAMCYDQHCYNSALPDPSPVLTAFGLTPTICADAQNCSAVNTFMTNTATDRTQNPSFLDNTLYTKNCGSLYTFNQSTRNTTIIWIGLGCLVIATLFTYLISSLLRASAFIVTLLCLLIIAVFAFLTYYGSSYLKGRWTCSSFGNKREQVESKPICVSVQNPDQVLPEECCQGEVTTSCECAVDQDCACAGGASQCNSGQCDYTEGSTKKRTSQTVTVNQPAVFSIAFMILLTISLPLIADLYLRLKKWHLNGVAYGILVLILMGVPLFFAVQFSSRTIQKNMFTDSCAV